MPSSKVDRVTSAKQALRPATPYDNLPEESYDRVARLAAALLHAPIAIVSLLDEDRHVVKSSVGLTGRSRVWRKVPLAQRFARQAVSSRTSVVIGDSKASSESGSASPAAAESPDGVAYAVSPILTVDGMVIGTIAVVDPAPHAWTATEIASLTDLAIQWSRRWSSGMISPRSARRRSICCTVRSTMRSRVYRI